MSEDRKVNGKTLRQWEKEIEEQFDRLFGMSTKDFADFRSRDLWESGGDFDEVVEALCEYDDTFAEIVDIMDENN